MEFLSSVWAWVLLHPVYVLLAWPALTALVNLVFGEAEKYAQTRPRLHAILAVIEAAGLDPRGVMAALAKLFGVTPPPAGGSGTPYRTASEAVPPTKPTGSARTWFSTERVPAAMRAFCLLVGMALGASAVASAPACNPQVQQDIVETVPAATACVLDVIDAATTGAVDIGAIIAHCGATAEDIIKIVQAELQKQSDASADGAASASKPRDRGKLLEAYRKAYAYKDAHR